MNLRASGAVPVDPVAILGAVRASGITDVVTVPDTHQKSLLALLSAQSDVRLITVCTEDEAVGVNLGLFIGGRRPLILLQNVGLYAALNTVRGLLLDANAPACLLIGEFARDPAVRSVENAARSVRMLEPTLDTWQVPYYRLEAPADIGHIGTAIRRAYRDSVPVAVLVGAPTAAVA
jgi:sulfopyruvate decarboxylase TPP-binding subunit